jgi:DNA-binding LytR/AlgR family response regulator
MKIRCLVVDDEQLARTLLQDFISKLPQLELVASCKNSMQAIEVLQKESVDLMFLDVQMPDLSGIDMLKTLTHKPVVIFTTAYPDYALEGYSLDVTDYLLKPFSFERFVQSVNKAAELIRLKKSAISETSKNEFLILNADHKIYKVRLEDILYIEGWKEYVRYHTHEKQYVVLQSLKSLVQSLPADRFMRIHRSYIIALDKVTALEGNQVEIAGKNIPIGKSYKEEVLSKVFR